ncbi:MAG: hypothetical protein ABIJ96_05985 [Elusimicrobiota bacterium]
MLHDRREFAGADRDFESAKSTVAHFLDRGVRFERIETIAHYVISIARAQRREDRTSTASPRCINTTTHYAPPQHKPGESREDKEE